MILTRNTANSPTSTDQYIRRVITNQAVAYMGYDAKLTDKLNLDGAVGFAWVPASAGAPTDLNTARPNSSDFMGTELSMTAGYQLYKNLSLQAKAGYMILGGYYKNSAVKADGSATDPENPYTMRLQARYSF
jgi:Flp pilus assembly protein TadG